jgi:hypothetical protein
MPFSSGSIFTLDGRVDSAALDYFGHGVIAATLVAVTAEDALGVPVPVSATFVPEPGTGAVLLLGLAAILIRARLHPCAANPRARAFRAAPGRG